MTPELVVLAAGIGSRYGGSKQLDPVGPNGELILDYSLFDARRAGIERVVVVIRRELETELRTLLERRHGRHMEIAFAHQELDELPPGFTAPSGRVKPWGTAHAVLAAQSHVRGPFVVINADDLYGGEGFLALVSSLSEEPAEPPARCAMAAFRLENTLSEHGGVSRGVCQVDQAGFLRAVREHTDLARAAAGISGLDPAGEPRTFSGRELVSMNLWGLRSSLLPHLEARFRRFLEASGDSATAELYLPVFISELIGEGIATVRVLPTESTWIGVTHRADREQVVRRLSELHRRGVYPERLWRETA